MSTYYVGQIFTVNLEVNAPPTKVYVDFPGKFEICGFDAKILQLVSVSWIPGVIDFHAPTMSLMFKALEVGETNIDYIMQLDKFNPLFELQHKKIIIKN